MVIGNVFAKEKPGAENLEARAAVVALADRLGVGQFASQECPQCRGGASKERSLSLGIEPNGMIKFYCHRAACGFQGNCYHTPGLVPFVRPQLDHVSHLNPLTVDLHPLSERELAYFADQYHIPASAAKQAIRRTAARYALRVSRPDGGTRGWITRRPWSNSPADTEANRQDSQYAVKALTFMEVDEPILSWYRPETTYGRGYEDIYLVEDQLSALRLCAYFDANPPGDDVAAVALLGSGINASKVGEIQRTARHARVHIALDADATGAAFAMARKWGQGFAACRVVILDKDIKDMTDDEVAELPL